jgi:membrane protein implicated in regulation of membrane protease activity
MTTVQTLYFQAPVWIWLAASAFLFALNLASGRGVLFWPALAAALTSLAALAVPAIGLAGEFPLFAALTVGGTLLSRRLPKPRPPAPEPEPPEPEPEPERVRVGSAEHSARLIGRIARTTGRFANGVGRVWIDGAEWAAELAGGDEELAPDTPVRITRVLGALRLQVSTLH